MTFLQSALRKAVEWVVDATPFGSSKKRKRDQPEEVADDHQVTTSNKRQAAPGSTKKALQFGQDHGKRPVNDVVQDLDHTVPPQQPAQQAPPAASTEQLVDKPRQLGEELVKRAAQPPTVYNSPLPATARRAFPSFTRPHAYVPPSPVVALSNGSLLGWVCQSGGTPSSVGQRAIRQQDSSLKPQLGQKTLFPQQGKVSGGRNHLKFGLPTSSPKSAATKRFSRRRTTGLQVQTMGQWFSRPAHPIEKPLVNHKERDLLRHAVEVAQELEQVHQHSVPPPVEEVDLTLEDHHYEQKPGWQSLAARKHLPGTGTAAAAGLQSTPSRGLASTPSLLRTAQRQWLEAQLRERVEWRKQQQTVIEDIRLPGLAASGGLAATPGGGLAFTSSLLTTLERRLHERESPAAVRPVAVEDGAVHWKDEDYQKMVAEAKVSMQHALEVNKTALKAARLMQTTRDRNVAEAREAQLKKQLEEIEEQLLHGEQRRQAAVEPKAAKPLHPPAALPEEESEVVEILSSDEEDEQEVHHAGEEYSAAESEESIQEDLAELTVSEELAELPGEYYESYDDVLRKNGNPLEQLVMHERSQIQICRKDIACMAPMQWLNDEVINIYMSLLLERDMRRRRLAIFPKCHFFNTFFANKLYKDTGYNYLDVQRWTMPQRLKLQGQLCESILDCDRVILPVHQGMHWVCAVIDISNKRLIYYDSLKGEDHKCLENLAKYVADEYKNKRNQTIDTSSWERVFPKNIPHQHNGCDCGVFTLMFAEYAARAAPMNFTQKHINYIRVKIVNDILKQRVE